MNEPAFWSVKEAARHINIHPVTLYFWLRPHKKIPTKNAKLTGPKPPFRRFGGIIRIPIDEFKRWANTSQEGKR